MSADNRTLRPLSRPILKSDVLRCLALVCLALSPATSNADKDKGGVIADLLELSLEQLLDLQVTSVSRKAESLHEAALDVDNRAIHIGKKRR